jgi:hypothetical protein
MSRTPPGGLLGLGALLALAPSSASASNNLHDRTEVVWEDDGACAIVVVRSDDPTVTLPYTLPDINDDGMVDTCDDDPSPDACDYAPDPVPNPVPGPDEVQDSRRHQFFASCRQRALDDPLPNWIDGTDLDTASETESCCVPNECAAGMCPLVEPDSVDDGDRLDKSAEWSCCSHAISDRRSISVAEAAKGITWDTSDVPEGVYAIDGYTWEPPYNLWSRRRGFVKVIDDASAADRFPAAAIMEVEDDAGADGLVEGCETVHVRGCVDAGEGSTLSLWWRHSRPDEHVWHRVMVDVAVEGGSFDIAWKPHELPQGKILVRVDVESADGSYTAHAPVSLETTGEQQCADAPDPDAEATTESNNADPVECKAPEPPRCECIASSPGEETGVGWWAFGLLLLRGRRRANPPLARPRTRW